MSKLVRDKIPQYIEEIGEIPEYETLHYENFEKKKKLLIEKLDEEVEEFKEGPSIEELADIVEVCHGLAAAMRYAPADLEAVRLGKYAARGGFYNGVILHG